MVNGTIVTACRLRLIQLSINSDNSYFCMCGNGSALSTGHVEKLEKPSCLNSVQLDYQSYFQEKCCVFTNLSIKMSRIVTKPTKHMRPAKTQISLSIRPERVTKDPIFLRVDSED